MPEIDTRTISLRTGQYAWEDIDKRAESLGFDRSKYTQRLYELEINHNLFNQPEKIKQLTDKKRIRYTDFTMLMLLISIVLMLLIIILLG